MARKPMVTRTFKTTEVNALVVNVQTGATLEKSVSIPRVLEGKKLESKLHSMIDNAEEKFVFAKEVSTSEQLYGMTEEEFIKNAKVLDEKTRKEIESEETEGAEVQEAPEETTEIEGTVEAPDTVAQETENKSKKNR